MYVPRAANRELGLTLLTQPQHGGGELILDGERLAVGPSQMRTQVELPPRDASGLHAIDVEWTGSRPLEIIEIGLDP